MVKPAYRAAQFLRAWIGSVKPHDLSLVDQHLPPSLTQLFRQMSPADQLHGIRVLQDLIELGERDPNLLAAGLLHDVGKSRVQLRLWERVCIVLASTLVPNLVKRWGVGQPKGWRRPFIVATQHSTWGAEMVEKAGGTPTLVRLIHQHQHPILPGPQRNADHLLRRLQQVDGTN
jgi:putative nucleotidyltransferase with HDIG domain